MILAATILLASLTPALVQSQPSITRFENGQTESLGGRTYRTTLHARPVNYLKNGTWQPITNALGSTGDPAMSVGVDELIQFRIADQLAGQSPVLHIGRGATHIKVAVLGTNTPTPGVVSGQSIRFNEAWNGADLEYVVGGHFVKESIYLKAGHPASFSFRIESHAGFDPATLVFGEFRILPPVLTKPGEAPVSLSWATSTVGGKTVLTATLPAGDWSGWVLDPTTILQPDATAGLDTWINQGNSSDNHETDTKLEIGDQDGAGSNASRVLIEFDVSSIPSSDTVTSATLSLYEYDAADTASVSSWAAGLRRVLVDWAEAQATWDDYSTSNAWTTGGAGSDGNDRSASDSASLTLDGTAAGAFVAWTGATLDDDVQKLVDGTYSNNYGWLLQAPTAENQGSSTAWNFFRSSDYATAGDRPKLVVVHSAVAAVRAFGVIIYSIPAGFPLGGLW
ncbi:MAG: DNRLRE domain-containing protein [bacterium]|nr:DNRLRE domain-containing protein [bacterium]